MSVFDLLAPASMLIVLSSLCFGVYALFRGGEFGRTWSNRMMRVRVIAQFAAVVLLLAALWWKQTYG